MTAEEHIVTWIESSQPHYRRLIELSAPENIFSGGAGIRARIATNLASSAYHEMIRCGDAYASEHDAGTILGAARMLAEWKLEQ